MEVIDCLKKLDESLQSLPEQVRNELGNTLVSALVLAGTFINKKI